jgi:hypothetical protein
LLFCTAIQQHIDVNALFKLAFIAKPISALALQPNAIINISELELTHNGPDEKLKVSNDSVVYSEVKDLLSYL